MRVELIKIFGSWIDIKNAARTTIGIEAGNQEPSSEWKRKLLLAEHSPIRKLSINWKWYDLKSWISVHFVRHKFGIEHWVRSQRPDRKGVRYNRDDAPQSALIEHEALANAQAIIFISRRRLCNQAMPETREAWKAVLESIKDKEPELYSVCVPDCIYRGHCYEYNSCNYHKTDDFKTKLEEYRKNINQ